MFKSCPRLLYQFIRNSRYAAEYAEPLTSITELNENIDSKTDITYKPIKALSNSIISFTFNDELLNKFTNMIMVDTNKPLAEELMAKLQEYNKNPDQPIELNPLTIFHQAIKNAEPLFWIMKVKRGGTTYQVPCPITPKQSRFRALKWFIECVREKEDNKILFEDRLAIELIDASQNKGAVIKRKRDLHILSEANKAYAHYRWEK